MKDTRKLIRQVGWFAGIGFIPHLDAFKKCIQELEALADLLLEAIFALAEQVADRSGEMVLLAGYCRLHYLKQRLPPFLDGNGFPTLDKVTRGFGCVDERIRQQL